MNRPKKTILALLGIAASVGLWSLIAENVPPIVECHKTIVRSIPFVLVLDPIAIEVPNYGNYWSNHPDCGTDEKALQEQYEKALRSSKKTVKGRKVKR
ncbi:hypothetical protein [Armatimonas sp.]|uniref:hypothetical protein n=1 Tax=Armatimonas sp. TaxID=1872638 RepID=UPI00286BB4FF|nr:hypothetical protein [Armatimonas sp.]